MDLVLVERGTSWFGRLWNHVEFTLWLFNIAMENHIF